MQYQHDRETATGGLVLMDALFAIAPALDQQMQVGLAERGLSLSRAVLLWEVAAADGPMMQRDLARALQVVPRTITGIVDDLTTAGLIARTAHPTDRRAVLVSLTEDGQRLMTRLTAERVTLAAQLFAGLTDAELRRAATVIMQAHDRLQALAGPPVTPAS